MIDVKIEIQADRTCSVLFNTDSSWFNTIKGLTAEEATRIKETMQRIYSKGFNEGLRSVMNFASEKQDENHF